MVKGSNMEPKRKPDEVYKTVIDPRRAIIDAHLHFLRSPEYTYEVEEYGRDTSSRHNIERPIFIKCSQDFDGEYAAHLKPVSDTEYAAHLDMRARERNRPWTGAEDARGRFH
jgi:hypothetical protein